MSAVQSVACRCRIRAAENKIPGKLPFAMRRILGFPGCCHHGGQEQRGDHPGTQAPRHPRSQAPRHPRSHNQLGIWLGAGMDVAWAFAWMRGCVASRGGPSCFNRFNEIVPLRIHAAGVVFKKKGKKTWQRTGSPLTVDYLQIGIGPGQDDTLSAPASRP